MEDIDHNVGLEEESLESVDEPASEMSNDQLKEAISQQMDKLRRQNLLLGAQSMCHVILNKIYDMKSKPGKKTYRDYERLINNIQNFCETGLSRKVNLDGETTEKESDSE